MKKKIRDIFGKRTISLYSLSLYYAGLAIRYFRQVQPAVPNSAGAFWHNRTAQAAARMFTNAELTKQFVSWFMAHGVEYGVYLELANDRKHEAIRKIIQRFAGRYFNDVRKLYKD